MDDIFTLLDKNDSMQSIIDRLQNVYGIDFQSHMKRAGDSHYGFGFKETIFRKEYNINNFDKDIFDIFCCSKYILNYLSLDYKHDENENFINDYIKKRKINIGNIFATCMDTLMPYMHYTGIKNDLFYELYDQIQAHVIISTLYTVTYLETNEYIKSYLLLSEDIDFKSVELRRNQIGNHFILQLDKNRNRQVEDSSISKKIQRAINRSKLIGTSVFYNTMIKEESHGKSTYIQNFLPYFAFICGGALPESQYVPSKNKYLTLAKKKSSDNRELNRQFKGALDDIEHDYLLLMDAFKQHSNSKLIKEDLLCQNVLFHYKLERLYPVISLSKMFHSIKSGDISPEEVLLICKLPAVFYRDTLWSAIENRSISIESIKYIIEFYLPLCENLFFSSMVSLYDNDYSNLKKDIEDYVRCCYILHSKDISINFNNQIHTFPDRQFLCLNSEIDNTSSESQILKAPYLLTFSRSQIDYATFEDKKKSNKKQNDNQVDYRHIKALIYIITQLFANQKVTTQFYRYDKKNGALSDKTKITLLYSYFKNTYIIPTNYNNRIYYSDNSYFARTYLPLGIKFPYEVNLLFIAGNLYHEFCDRDDNISMPSIAPVIESSLAMICNALLEIVNQAGTQELPSEKTRRQIEELFIKLFNKRGKEWLAVPHAPMSCLYPFPSSLGFSFLLNPPYWVVEEGTIKRNSMFHYQENATNSPLEARRYIFELCCICLALLD